MTSKMQRQELQSVRWLTKWVQFFCSIGIISLVACGGGEATPTRPSEFEVPVSGGNVGGDGDLFDPNRLLNIQITIPTEEYEILRREGRTLASTARECVPDFEYTEFEATVVIDGDRLEKVGVRKKGFLGSLSPNRPSFKFDFDEVIDGQTYQHMKRMTLNNNRQDTSNARQCMTYDYFRKAGLVAPRCNLASLTVNGEFLGIYTNLEAIKKPFLARSYGDDEGNLYEAQIADFGQFLNDKFEKKTNESENDRSDLKLVSDVLALPDDDFIQALPSIVDVDEFIRFWAMESLLGHWDSASGNANNFYIYRSPVDNLFHFIPWGTDASFTGFHFLKPASGPLYRNFNLSSRLYQIPAYRNQYLATISEYLNTIWNEDEFEEELSRIATLTDTKNSALESIRQFVLGKGVLGDIGFVRSQRSRLESAISGLEPEETEYLLADEQPNCELPVSTNLEANASSFNNVDSGTFNFSLPSGQRVDASLTLASISVDSFVTKRETITTPAVMSLLLIGADINDNFKPYVLQVFVEEPEFISGSHELHGFATNIILFEVDESRPLEVKTLALGAEGTITLSNVNVDNEQVDVTVSIDAILEYLPDDDAQ